MKPAFSNLSTSSSATICLSRPKHLFFYFTGVHWGWTFKWCDMTYRSTHGMSETRRRLLCSASKKVITSSLKEPWRLEPIYRSLSPNSSNRILSTSSTGSPLFYKSSLISKMSDRCIRRPLLPWACWSTHEKSFDLIWSNFFLMLEQVSSQRLLAMFFPKFHYRHNGSRGLKFHYLSWFFCSSSTLAKDMRFIILLVEQFTSIPIFWNATENNIILRALCHIIIAFWLLLILLLLLWQCWDTYLLSDC